MKTLILGGVRSGKSRLAESLAKKNQQSVTYIATASADDEEMAKRIEIHKKHRPKEWSIIEEPLDLSAALKKHANENNCILIDCLTLWITNLLLFQDGNSLEKNREDFLKYLKNTKNDIIIVSNETGLGIMPLGELTRKFGDEAGITNQAVAALCDRVILTVAGLPLVLKGKPL